MVVREAARSVSRMAKTYPVVTVAGPRHAGKTTLVKMLFSRHAYVNLEAAETREFARSRPDEFVKQYVGHQRGVVIDECARAPELFDCIRDAVRDDRRPGRFILATSKLPREKYDVMTPIRKHRSTQILFPLNIRELRYAKIALSRDEYIVRGFMPRVYKEDTDDPGLIYLNYLTYFVNHDAKECVAPDERETFWHLLRTLARRVGQIINLDAMAMDIGVHTPTLLKWFAALESNFIIFKLPPYHNFAGWRNTTIPKFYFTDTGMAAYLLNIRSPEQVFRDPAIGNLFENMVVADAMKCRYNALWSSIGLYYFRSQKSAGGRRPLWESYNCRNPNILEIDLIMDNGRRVVPVDIKSTHKYSSHYADSIKDFRKVATRAEPGYVAYGGKTRKLWPGEPAFINFTELAAVMSEWKWRL